MVQLQQEGWIHHLARHAVGCFLTRGDLFISWEEGMKVILSEFYSLSQTQLIENHTLPSQKKKHIACIPEYPWAPSPHHPITIENTDFSGSIVLNRFLSGGYWMQSGVLMQGTGCGYHAVHFSNSSLTAFVQ